MATAGTHGETNPDASAQTSGFPEVFSTGLKAPFRVISGRSALASDLGIARLRHVKIAIVEDQLMMADALAILCESELRCKVVARATSGRGAIKAIVASNPDLVLLDLGLPDADGFQVMEVVRRAGCHPRVLVLSGHCDDHTVYRVERAGFDGFVDKSSGTLETLRFALKTIAKNQAFFSKRFLRIRSKRISDPHAIDKVLTGAEQAVLSYVGGLLTDREIAERLQVSAHTPEKHRFNILHKLGLRSKIALIRYALAHGFKPLTDGTKSPRPKPAIERVRKGPNPASGDQAGVAQGT
jgi:DNA-binding NarL/FixJ family response regulator